MKTRWIVSVLVVSCSVSAVSHAQYQTERGAAIGGIGGALAGAAIGKNNGDTGAGALIGGAVGLVTGAVVGNSVEQKARAQAYQQQRAYQMQMSRAVSNTDVITMAHNGLSEDVIINHIRENGVQRRPEVSDVILLHKNGVGEATIAAMQTAPVGAPAPVYVAPAPRYVVPAPAPVIVHEYYAPRPYWGPSYYYGHHHHHHGHHYGHGHGHGHSGVHWGVTIGH